jgi:hypothetical protein
MRLPLEGVVRILRLKTRLWLGCTGLRIPQGHWSARRIDVFVSLWEDVPPSTPHYECTSRHASLSTPRAHPDRQHRRRDLVKTCAAHVHNRGYGRSFLTFHPLSQRVRAASRVPATRDSPVQRSIAMATTVMGRFDDCAEAQRVIRAFVEHGVRCEASVLS